MAATPDAFFVDVTSELNSTGATWEEIVAFMKLKSLHPLKKGILHYTNLGDQDIDALFKGMTTDIQVYRIREDVPSFLVHRGALSAFRKMFRLPHTDWRMDNVLAKIKKGQYAPPYPMDLAKLEKLSDNANTLYYETAVEMKDQSEAAQVKRLSFLKQHFEKVELIASVIEAELLLRQAFNEAPKK